MKSSPSIWHLLHNVKSTVKISSNFVVFLKDLNFKYARILLCHVHIHNSNHNGMKIDEKIRENAVS